MHIYIKTVNTSSITKYEWSTSTINYYKDKAKKSIQQQLKNNNNNNNC